MPHGQLQTPQHPTEYAKGNQRSAGWVVIVTSPEATPLGDFMFRHCLGAALAFAATLMAGQAAAQATTYTFTAPLYSTVTGPVNCTVGECSPYTTAQRAVITLTFAAPLAPNLPIADRSAALTAYTLNDGIRTTTGPAANAVSYFINIGTDATGLPNNYQVLIERTPGPPYPVNAPADPNSRLTYVVMTQGVGTNALANYICANRASSGGAVTGPGSCNNTTQDVGSSQASAGAPVVTSAPAAVPVAAVPTMTEWAMILFGLLLAGGAALYIQRRQQFV